MAKPFRIGTLLYDNLLGTSATLPVEMLKTAEAAALASDKQARRISTVLISRDLNPVKSPSGLYFQPTHTLEQIEQCDLLNLPALWRNPRPALIKYQADYVPWLQQIANQGNWITSVGTGVCFLAEAGLLDGQAATTHWHYFDNFQKNYPRVHLKRQYFTTQAGNYYCAASVNAMAELMVHLCNRLYGPRVASIVERNFFHEIRNSFTPNSFFSEHVPMHPDEQVMQAQIWLEDNFSLTIKMTDVAQQFGFSHRNFNRRFYKATGKTPLQYLREVRLRNACELLGKSNLTVGETANKCGYQSVATFSQIFHKFLHTSPKKYRETARGKLFSRQTG